MQKFLGLAQKELLVKGQFDFILQDELTCRTMSSKLHCYILHVVCIMLVTSVKDVSKISQKFSEQLFRRTNPYLKTYSFTGVLQSSLLNSFTKFLKEDFRWIA